MLISYNLLSSDYKDYLRDKDYGLFFYTEIELKISEQLTLKSEMHKAFLDRFFRELEYLFKGKKKKKDDSELSGIGWTIIYIMKMEGKKIYIKEYDEYDRKTKSVSYLDKYDFIDGLKTFMGKYKKEIVSIQPEIVNSSEYKELEEQFQKTLKAASL
ncbi:hypothetical protein AWM68_14375 [Fictibacillus phosphorivorans]|uniref:Uncharacterized protein n=1 Tax=Fictibacillus phosphorivorans TaxID=1221500 RepID=A0A163PX83_9BACL|nr:hypothetical protein [Fictibacillus phosphorivorans]KZE64272.1 hypothetical protein AWM68_14375 [Fictibacillus phosphorivorans]